MFSRIAEGERGDSRIRNLIILFVVVVVVYAGYKFIPVYIDYYRVKNMFASELNTARDMPIDYIEGNVKRKIAELSLPVPEDAVTVEKVDALVKIYATYNVVIQFPLDYYIELTFSPYVEKEFK
jgi:hypothetical protein